MTKKVGLAVIAFHLFFKISAISLVNNVTVPSDILTKIFFDEIRNSENLFNISVENTNNYNSTKCISGLQEIVNRFPDLEVLPFLDAWGKMPSGILYGHLVNLGNFDQCVRAAYTSEAIGTVKGQYCFASIPLIQNQTLEKEPLSDYDRIQSRPLVNYIKISIAICVPDSCHPSLVKMVLQTAADSILNGALSGINVDRCQTAKKSSFEPINIVGIVIFSTFGLLMLLSTLYEACIGCFTKKPVIPILLAFSVLTNGSKLFAINTKTSPNSIDCLLGIRVLSMFWVIYCHNYLFTLLLPLINVTDITSEWMTAASSMHVLMASVSVDSFLFMSGLLVAWLGLRELDKSNGKLNILIMYLHRYIRLTPPVAAVILFIVSLNKYFVFGPYGPMFGTIHDSCKERWWSTLLYVQNYVSDQGICILQSWYLAVDFQLYILSPLILIPLWKWGRKFTPIMVILAFLSIGCVIGTYFSRGYNNFMGIFGADQYRLTYMPTHTRYSVWLVGAGLGYFMYINKNKSMNPSKIVQLLGWLLCFSTILAIIYGPYFTLNADRETSVTEAAMYEGLRRVAWAIALSWIVFSCHFGFGGIINAFLSHPFWQPLARLTYSLFLVHMLVQSAILGATRTDVYFSNYAEVLFFWSTFGICLMVAIVLTLAFEAPILVIEKAILGSSKSNDKQQSLDLIKNGSDNTCQKSA